MIIFSKGDIGSNEGQPSNLSLRSTKMKKYILISIVTFLFIGLAAQRFYLENVSSSSGWLLFFLN